MDIETSNLILMPLNIPLLQKYIQPNNVLENYLYLSIFPRSTSEKVIENITKNIIPAILKNELDYLFYTFWIIIHKQTNAVVAELGFKGPPNNLGSIEIGYSTYPSFREKGYMNEALKNIITWALKQPKVQSIIAQTDSENLASKHLLKKNNFSIFGKEGNNIVWQIKL